MVCTPLPTGAGGFVSYAEIATTPHIGRGHSNMILPAIVRECTVRFGHAMRVFPLLDRIAAIVRCIKQFTRQPSRHSGFTTRARGGDAPTNSQRLRAVRPPLNRNLIENGRASCRERVCT